MNKLKVALWALAVVLVAVAGGWLGGAWGRWGVERRLADATLRAELVEARASLWAARVDVFELNFGNASRNIERAKRALGAAADQLDAAGRSDRTAAVRESLAKAVEAQQLAGKVDQTANARVAEAIAALARAGDGRQD